MSKLLLTILGCRDLENKDTFSKSDPFVVVYCCGNKYKTKVMQDNLNPNFNEQFVFFIENLAMEDVSLEVYDADPISDDLIGGCTLPSLGSLERGKTFEAWYPLQPPAEKGLIGVSVLVEDFGSQPCCGGSASCQ
eukprot:PhM_4_TR12501/c0_g1_i1/m.65055